MNCTKHPNVPAVAQCSNCGAGVCTECAEITEPARESCGVLCVDCYKGELERTITSAKKKNGKRLTRVLISSILYLIGVIAAICGVLEIMDGAGDGVPILILGIVLCGLYTGLTWKKAAQDKHDRDEMQNGATYVITDDGIYKKDAFWLKLVYFFIGVALGVIMTPVNVIRGSVTYAKFKKLIKGMQKELSALN
ncbi:MAG: hypothetical protein K2I30_05180 [Clostridia bacterium]|nr:hypothetical protein [Clostridia bacterium]